MAHGYYLEAEYESGYVHRETEEDISPWKKDTNFFNDILEHRPEAVHGKMVRFALVGPEERTDIDWKTLPDNARPIYFRQMQHIKITDIEAGEATMIGQTFGYQYNDAEGNNHKEIKEII